MVSQLIMVIFLLQLLFLLPLVVCSDDDKVACEPGEANDCSKCYIALAEQVTKHDRNAFKIQTTFFPPDSISPVFVTVNYIFKDPDKPNSTSEKWFWSRSMFYLLQPLDVFQYTSLFFSDTQLQQSDLSLELPLNCINASFDHKQLLTQRVC